MAPFNIISISLIVLYTYKTLHDTSTRLKTSSGIPRMFYLERTAVDTGRTRTAVKTHHKKFIHSVQYVCLFVWKFNMFLHTV